jgi:cytochrome b
VEGLPLITDGSFSVFFTGTIAASITLIVSILGLYFATSRNGSQVILEIGVVVSLIVYLVFMLYWGVLTRKIGRSNILRQWTQ